MAWRDFAEGSGSSPSNESGGVGMSYVDAISTSMRSIVDASSLADERVELPPGHVDAVSSSMRSLAEEGVDLPPDYVDAMTSSMRSLAEERVEVVVLSGDGVEGTGRSRLSYSARRPLSTDDDKGSSFVVDAMKTSFRSLVDEEVMPSSSSAQARSGMKGTASSGGTDTRTSNNRLEESSESHQHATATMASSVVTLVNTCAGTGLLGLPGAFARSGLAGGSILLAASCSFSAIGLRLLAKSAETTIGIRKDGPSSFFSVAKVALPRFTVVTDVAVALKCFGVAVSYLMTAGDCMVDASQYLLRDFGRKGTHFLEGPLTSRQFWVGIALCAAMPISFYRTLDSLKVASALSLQLKVALVVAIVLYAQSVFDPCEERDVASGSSISEEGSSAVLTEPTEDMSNGEGQNVCRGETVLFTDFRSTFTSLAIFVFCFSCHQNIFPVMNEMKCRTESRVDRVVYFTTGVALILYLLVAVEGYRTYGSNVKGDVLLNYPQTALLTALRIFVAAMLVLSYPLQLDPCRRCISSLICEWKRSGYYVDPIDANSSMASLADEISMDEQEMEQLRSGDDFLPVDDNVASETEGGSSGQFKASKDNTIWLSVHGGERTTRIIGKYATDDERARSSFEFSTTTLAILALSFVIAMMVSDLGVALAVVGASGSTIITFILPGAIYLKLHPTFHLLKALAYVQVILGFIILPSALYFVVSQREGF